MRIKIKFLYPSVTKFEMIGKNCQKLKNKYGHI